MSFRQNLVKARSHLVFLAALATGLMVVTMIDGRLNEVPASQAAQRMDVTDAGPGPMDILMDIEPLPLAAPQPLTPPLQGAARTAWRYFENNTDPNTGLVNSAHGYPSTTMWETGSYFVAVRSAHRLGLISEDDAETRIGRALDTLATLRLFDGVLPNKAYHARTGALVNYGNEPVERGLGWSALDIARVVGTFSMIQDAYPALAPNVDAVLTRWDLNLMVRDGQLIGGNMIDGRLRHDQEGRIGYEQYAAKAMMLFGFDMYQAYQTNERLMVQDVAGQPIPVDARLHRNTTPAFTVSEPYVFDGLEFGFDQRSHRFATAIYKAQEERWANTGTFTAVSESHLDEAPYFAYATVWGGGAPWAVMSFRGERLDSKRTTATKIAFAWDALFGTAYTKALLEHVLVLGDPDKGFPEGIYEASGDINGSYTANTNAVILAALAFRENGPLQQVGR